VPYVLWSSWQPQVLLEVRPSDVPKVLINKVGRQIHTLVQFLQIKLPACRVIIFLENDKKFSKFGHLKCIYFTISQLKNAKKPRGYRIFSRNSFVANVFIFSTTNYISLQSPAARRKKLEKSFGNLINFCNFFQKNFKKAILKSHSIFRTIRMNDQGLDSYHLQHHQPKLLIQ
jgi:hypothetical protein